MSAPNGDDWMAIRDIAKVDGKEIKDRLSVLDELKRLPIHEVVTAFKSHNSKFNIGRTFRNFNEPTLSLRIFGDDRRRRVVFAQRRVERTKDGPLVVVSFSEQEGPGLIHDLTYGTVLSKGEFTIEPTSGRIQRAFLTASAGPIRLELATDYVLDKRLDIWVPSRFRERYEHGKPPTNFESTFEYEDISCEAKYLQLPAIRN